MELKDINENILCQHIDANLVSDGYHTFGELYEHRIVLYIQLCKMHLKLEKLNQASIKVWKSKRHSDGSEWDGWFILGLGTVKGKQITYHLPISKWNDIQCIEFTKAPTWDGHSSNDVLERLKKL